MYQAIMFLYIGFFILCVLVLLIFYESRRLVSESEERLNCEIKKAMFEIGKNIDHEHKLKRFLGIDGSSTIMQCSICGELKINHYENRPTKCPKGVSGG